MSSAASTAKTVVSLIPGGSEPFNRPLMSAELFSGMIARERKRSDRSGNGFILMLLDSGALLSQPKTMKKVAEALSSCMRDTDLAGWYRDQQTLGVIFTEISAESNESTAEILQARAAQVLRENLKEDQVRQVIIRCHFYPNVDTPDSDISEPSVMYPDLQTKQESKKVWFSFKRLIDIFGSLLALLVATPLFLLIALAIKLTSKGPVFFRQTRVGQYGVPFTFLKFRSMLVNCDPSIHKQYVQQLIAGKAERMTSDNAKEGVYKLTKDPRITPVGSFLRRTSFDELPQFINVLRGDMSLVGPRPAVPYEVEAYDLWHRSRIFEVKPGITGLWQVNGRSRVKFDDMVRLDLRYARACSFWLDIKILLLTPIAVVFGEGAY
jgi:lipopolysaccharide/colanic/teichoic acid biosynthesis glycosyltransferase